MRESEKIKEAPSDGSVSTLSSNQQSYQCGQMVRPSQSDSASVSTPPLLETCRPSTPPPVAATECSASTSPLLPPERPENISLLDLQEDLPYVSCSPIPSLYSAQPGVLVSSPSLCVSPSQSNIAGSTRVHPYIIDLANDSTTGMGGVALGRTMGLKRKRSADIESGCGQTQKERLSRHDIMQELQEEVGIVTTETDQGKVLKKRKVELITREERMQVEEGEEEEEEDTIEDSSEMDGTGTEHMRDLGTENIGGNSSCTLHTLRKCLPVLSRMRHPSLIASRPPVLLRRSRSTVCFANVQNRNNMEMDRPSTVRHCKTDLNLSSALNALPSPETSQSQ